VIVKSREMTGRSQTLRDGWGRRGKDDRKQNTLAPLLLNVKNEGTILYIFGSETGAAACFSEALDFKKKKRKKTCRGYVTVVYYYVIEAYSIGFLSGRSNLARRSL
jgi:hypothetical protein